MRLVSSNPAPVPSSIPAFLDSLRSRNRSERTARVYAHACGTLEAAAGRPLESLSRADLARWNDSMTRAGLSAATRANYLSGLREFYAWAAETGIRPDDPMHGARTFEIRRKDVIGGRRWKGLRRRLVSDLRAHAHARASRAATFRARALALRDAAVLEVLADGAIRADECCNLAVENFTAPPGSLTVTGKGGKTRGVPLGQSATRALVDYLDARPTLFAPGPRDARQLSPMTGPLFLTDAGTRLYGAKAVERIVARASRAAGISEPIRPHALRHTRANEIIELGVAIRDAQIFLGHADPSTTTGYLDRSGAGLRKRLSELGAL